MRLKSFAALSALTLVFVGCGDDITEKTVVGTQWVDAIADEECTAAKTGLIAYSKDDGSSWYCDGEKWTTLDGAKGKKGPQGDQGEPGEVAKNGKKGDDCALVPSDDPGVALVACHGDTVQVAQSDRGTFVDARDKHVYGWTKIGLLTVMSQNLDYGRKVDLGSASIYSTVQPVNTKWCWHDSAAYCNIYGGAYQWHIAMGLPDSCMTKSCRDQWKFAEDSVLAASPYYWEGGICPAGWHVTNRTEYGYIKRFADTVAARVAGHGKIELFAALSASNISMKTYEDSWYDGLDLVGFSALPAGAFDDGDGVVWKPGFMVVAWHDPEEYDGNPEMSKAFALGWHVVVEPNYIQSKAIPSQIRCTMNYADTSKTFYEKLTTY